MIPPIDITTKRLFVFVIETVAKQKLFSFLRNVKVTWTCVECLKTFLMNSYFIYLWSFITMFLRLLFLLVGSKCGWCDSCVGCLKTNTSMYSYFIYLWSLLRVFWYNVILFYCEVERWLIWLLHCFFTCLSCLKWCVITSQDKVFCCNIQLDNFFLSTIS